MTFDKFTGPLKIEVLPRSAHPMRWRVVETFEFHVGRRGSGVFIRCFAGDDTDLTSIPPGLRWLISPSDPDLAQAAVVHDMAYRRGTWTVRLGEREREAPLNRAAADGIMLEAMKARDVPKWKRTIVYQGLKVGGWIGWNAWRKRNPDAIRTDTTT